MKISVPILEYHDLSNRADNKKDFYSPYILIISKFYEHMKWLYENEYKTITIDDLIDDNIPEKSVVLTFDDGHISNYKLAFPILQEFSFKATFFIYPTVIGKEGFLSIPQIEEMAQKNMRFESHSLTHPYIVTLNNQDIKYEVYESKIQIQKILNCEVNHFSVPFGFYNKYLISCLKESGYKSLITENFGYCIYKDKSFSLLPRFTIKSDIDQSIFQNIIQGRRKFLIAEYIKACFLQSLKAVLGCKNYIYIKSLALGSKPQNIRHHSK